MNTFSLMFKTPDVLYQIHMYAELLGPGEREKFIKDAKGLASNFVKYGETIFVEFNLEKGTTRVVPLT